MFSSYGKLCPGFCTDRTSHDGAPFQYLSPVSRHMAPSALRCHHHHKSQHLGTSFSCPDMHNRRKHAIAITNHNIAYHAGALRRGQHDRLRFRRIGYASATCLEPYLKYFRIFQATLFMDKRMLAAAGLSTTARSEFLSSSNLMSGAAFVNSALLKHRPK